MSVSIIIPAYNEEDALESVVARVQKLPIEKEIIVVNDGSTDGTADVARSLDVLLVDRPGNIGYGKSIKDGMRSAKYDTVALTDADGTYPIEEIPTLVELHNKGFDMVVGARQGGHYWSSPLKSMFRIILRTIVQFVSGQKIPDINSGLRVFSKKTAQQYEQDLCDTFSFTTTITLIFFLTKHTVAYVPISYDKRIGKTKVRHIRDSLRTMQYITECIARYNPLKLFLLLAVICIVFGAIGYIVIGWLSILLGLLFSVLVFSIGLLIHGVQR